MRILCMLPAAKGVYPAEAEERRLAVMRSYASPATQIDVDYMPDVSGFNPWGGQDRPDHSLADKVSRAHALGAQRAMQAEKDGYDAFCPYGVLDIGVEEARRQGVKIPVVGQGEAAALFCGLLGRKFAACFYVSTPDHDTTFMARIRSWGVADLYVGPTAIGIPNSEYPSRRPEVLSRFVDCARQAREMGAELMGIVAMSICPTEFPARELTEAGGLPVQDALAAQIAMAEWWHRTGLPPSLLRLPR
ncbi:MAG TPA: aspartate/glutamate racemase family protein [Chloroflexota bacterium]|nr:aspartate/glutamate racemase family protein [Chloroflexota bacterium]